MNKGKLNTLAISIIYAPLNDSTTELVRSYPVALHNLICTVIPSHLEFVYH